MNCKLLASAVIRSGYLFTMYTGVRALANRFRSRFLPVPLTSVLDGAVIPINESESVRVRVHARDPPTTSGHVRVGGMISVYLEEPGISRSLYSLLRVSSHFGCGHIELAFCERGGSVCVYAVRNILRSNLHRLRCGKRFCSLSLWTDQDEIVVLARVIEELRKQCLDAYLAPPAECVKLAVSPSLLSPKKRELAFAALTRKYERMAKRFSRSSIGCVVDDGDRRNQPLYIKTQMGDAQPRVVNGRSIVHGHTIACFRLPREPL